MQGPRLSPQSSKIKVFKKSKKKKKKKTLRDSPKLYRLNHLCLPQSTPKVFGPLGSRNKYPGPKNQNFQKMKKAPPVIHSSYKCANFQTGLTIYAFPRVPQTLQGIHTHTHTHIHTHTHTESQVLAQLKLRKSYLLIFACCHKRVRVRLIQSFVFQMTNFRP